MSTIKDFNQLINTSTNNRFSLWSDYRKYVTDLIYGYLQEANIKEAFLIGAGASDDLDIKHFMNQLTHITLSDIDVSALNLAVQKYQLKQNQYNIQEMDYTGLADLVEWNDFVKIMLRIKNHKQIDQLIEIFKKSIENNHFSIEQKFDSVIVSPIYTQLLFHQLNSNLTILNNLNYSIDLINYCRNQFLEIMPKVISHFNNNILKLLKINGLMIVMSDIFEASVDSPVYTKISSAMHSRSSMEQYYQEYFEKYGYGLGDFGLSDLETKAKQTDAKWIAWPFTENKTIYVKLVIYRKEKEQ